MQRWTVLALRALIVLALVLMLSFQALISVGFFAGFPDAPADVTPADIIVWTCIFCFVICVECVLVCVWRLVTLAADGRIFARTTLSWVDLALGAVLLATALVLTAVLAIGLGSGGGVPPVLLVAGGTGIVFGLGLALVVLVLRDLLRRATTLEHDLAEVI